MEQIVFHGSGVVGRRTDGSMWVTALRALAHLLDCPRRKSETEPLLGWMFGKYFSRRHCDSWHQGAAVHHCLSSRGVS